MTAILEDDFFKCIFLNEKFCVLIKISMTFVRKGPIDDNPVLVEMGAKPLSEPMLTRFTDAYMRH